MKRIFVILLTLVLLLGICPMSALAETGGSGNVDGGGGDMGQGTSQNSWNPGTLVWMVYELLWLMQNPVSLCRPLLI